MSHPRWPDTVPPFLREPFEQSSIDGRRPRAGEGVPRYTRRFSLNAQAVSLGIEATLAQKVIFFDFFQNDLAGGSNLFVMPDPTLDGVRLATDDYLVLADENGTDLSIAADWLCLFGDEMPSMQVRGGRFVINFSVWVMP